MIDAMTSPLEKLAPRFSADDVRSRADTRLVEREPGILPRRGDYDLNPELLPDARKAVSTLTPAAVLIPVVERAGEARLVFTQRTTDLPAHAGQVSFPGGKVDESDLNPVDAALREAEEEIGLAREFVDVIGELDSYQTGTGFHIHTVIGVVSGEARFTRNEREVSEVFDVPLRYLMAPSNFQQHKKFWRGKDRAFYAISYEERYIWGATAGIVRNFYERLYSEG